MAMLLPLVAAVGGVTCALGLPTDGVWVYVRWLGWVCAALGVLFCLTLVHLIRLPRLGYQDGELLVYLGSATPIRVPISIVEVFFLGQGSALMKARGGEMAETATIVVRLAEAAKEWHNRDVKATFGQWCDGYIVIRGTWCEPINAELLTRLNHKLVEVHRQQRETAASESP